MLHSACVEVILQFQPFLPAQFVHTSLRDIRVVHTLREDLSSPPVGPLITMHSFMPRTADPREACNVSNVREGLAHSLQRWHLSILQNTLWESVTMTALGVCCSASQAIAVVGVSNSILKLQVVNVHQLFLSSTRRSPNHYDDLVAV